MADGIEAFFEEQETEENTDANTGSETSAEGEAEGSLGEGGSGQDGEGAPEGNSTPPASGEAEENEAGEATGQGEEDGSESGEEGSEGEGHTSDSGDVQGEEGPPEDNFTDLNNDTLRTMLREQASEIQTLSSQILGLTQKLVEGGTLDESDLGSEDQESASNTDDRTQALSLLAETMKVNPVYADFEEVCSQSNLDRTVQALAHVAQQEDGGTLTENVTKVTDYIWNLPNPYKFVYDFVKANSPKYRESSSDGPAPPETTKKPPKAPPSVGSVPGGGGSKNEGWTAAKIDAMPEDELHNVPEAVYEKYMRNELA